MSATGGSENEPARFQPELAKLLLSEETVAGLLDIVVNLSVSAVAGVQGASISLVVSDGDHLETSNASSQQIRTVDEGQYQDGEGPCVEAIRTGREVRITLPLDRWPTFAGRAEQAGVSSVLSLPLRVDDHTSGALNLYSVGGGPVSEAGAEVARALASQAAVVLANAVALASAKLTGRHLEEALNNRDLIGQAKGVLMARHRISADAAFDLLRGASQGSGRKLSEIATEMLSNPGDQPEERP